MQKKQYLMVKTAKTIFDKFIIGNVCGTVLKRFFILLLRYGKYNKNLNGYNLFIINFQLGHIRNLKFCSREKNLYVYCICIGSYIFG